jgi:hypothetical protein
MPCLSHLRPAMPCLSHHATSRPSHHPTSRPNHHPTSSDKSDMSGLVGMRHACS